MNILVSLKSHVVLEDGGVPSTSSFLDSLGKYNTSQITSYTTIDEANKIVIQLPQSKYTYYQGCIFSRKIIFFIFLSFWGFIHRIEKNQWIFWKKYQKEYKNCLLHDVKFNIFFLQIILNHSVKYTPPCLLYYHLFN